MKKLAVEEINQDVANMTQERAAFAETLNRQENFIKGLVARGEDGKIAIAEKPLQTER